MTEGPALAVRSLFQVTPQAVPVGTGGVRSVLTVGRAWVEGRASAARQAQCQAPNIGAVLTCRPARAAQQCQLRVHQGGSHCHPRLSPGLNRLQPPLLLCRPDQVVAPPGQPQLWPQPGLAAISQNRSPLSLLYAHLQCHTEQCQGVFRCARLESKLVLATFPQTCCCSMT